MTTGLILKKESPVQGLNGGDLSVHVSIIANPPAHSIMPAYSLYLQLKSDLDITFRFLKDCERPCNRKQRQPKLTIHFTLLSPLNHRSGAGTLHGSTATKVYAHRSALSRFRRAVPSRLVPHVGVLPHGHSIHQLGIDPV